LESEPPPEHVAGFRVIRRLATGGTSDVLLARAEGPNGFDRTVVLKLLLAQYKQDPKFERMFAREAAAYARLNHPSIVKLYDFFSTDSRHGSELVMVLEFVDGISLAQLRTQLQASQGSLDDRASIFLASSVFAALAAAHAARDVETNDFAPVIHRDVNPSNVLIPWDGQVKLADFGIAKVTGLTGDTKVGRIKGTFGYMAPEQVRGEEVSVCADVYAATLLLWELLAKRRAIQNSQLPEIEILRAMAHPSFVSLDLLRPDLPKAVRDLVTRGLKIHPAERDLKAHEAMQILRGVVSIEEGRAALVKALATVRPVSDDDVQETMVGEMRDIPPEPLSTSDLLETNLKVAPYVPSRAAPGAPAANGGGSPHAAAASQSLPRYPTMNDPLEARAPGVPRPAPAPVLPPVPLARIDLVRASPVAAAPVVPAPIVAASPPRPASRPPSAPTPPLAPRPQVASVPMPGRVPEVDESQELPRYEDAPRLERRDSDNPPTMKGGFVARSLIPESPHAPVAAGNPPEGFALARTMAASPEPMNAVAPSASASVRPGPVGELGRPLWYAPGPEAGAPGYPAIAARAPRSIQPPPTNVLRIVLIVATVILGLGAAAGAAFLLLRPGKPITKLAASATPRPTAPAVTTSARPTSTAIATASPPTATTASATPPATVAPPPTASAPTVAATPTAAPTTPPKPTAAPTATGSGDTGEINALAPAATGHRVFVDGKTVGEGASAYRVKCGSHTVKIGSGGKPMTVDVPCGGSVNVP
jgi:serine/threonine-protein kinase